MTCSTWQRRSTPLLTSHSQASGCHATGGGGWCGQRAEPSALTNFTGAGCGPSPSGGRLLGRLTVNNLASVKDGSVIFEVDGAGSLVNLAALTTAAARAL
ncbi:MAG: hypothetical protein U1F65_07235 [Verrucomicrobiota bacterium]